MQTIDKLTENVMKSSLKATIEWLKQAVILQKSGMAIGDIRLALVTNMRVTESSSMLEVVTSGLNASVGWNVLSVGYNRSTELHQGVSRAVEITFTNSGKPIPLSDKVEENEAMLEKLMAFANEQGS